MKSLSKHKKLVIKISFLNSYLEKFHQSKLYLYTHLTALSVAQTMQRRMKG